VSIERPDDSCPVWYLIGTLAVGGAERTLIDLATNLDDRFDPTIWTIADPGPLATSVPASVPVKSLGARSKADVRAPIRFVRALRHERLPILQSFLFFDNTLARLAGVCSPETTVITGVRSIPDSMPLHRDLLDRATLRLSDHIVSNSYAGADWIVDRGADEKRVSVVHNGRDVQRFASATASAEIWTELGLSSGPVVGTVGRLVERKGGFDLLDAWPIVVDRHPDAKLLFVGDGPQREALEQAARDHSVDASVVFAGRREDVPEILDLLDVFAFPSHYEGLPGALLEAMCAGLPIVTTPVDGCSELVIDGQHGTHVPVAAPEAIADAIVEYLSNADRARIHGEAAKRRAEAEFSLDAMVDGFETLYDNLLVRRPR